MRRSSWRPRTANSANVSSSSSSASAWARKDPRVSDELARWASTRAADLIARAEAEAVAEIKAALLDAVSVRAPTVAPRRESVRPASAEPLLWAYCVAHAAESPHVELPGVGEGVEWIEQAGLAAAVSRVSADEFGEDVLPESLNDL